MALYLGKKRVAPSVQVKVPSMKAFFDAGGKCAYSTATSFEGIIKYEDTSNVTNMMLMFSRCSQLTSIPLIDTSNVTSMTSMFYSCTNLTSIPLIDTSNVTSMSSMFESCFQSLTTIPQLNTSNVTDMTSMFRACTNLTSVPLIDTSNVKYMTEMFNSCLNLTSIPQLNTSNVTDMNAIFYRCSSLTEIHMYGMKVNFDISVSTKFTRDALVEILNNLATVTSTQTLNMGSTNLAKLTDEDKAIATGKGWTLA